RRAERAGLALRLRHALRAPTIERRATPPAAEFFARYWETNTPVILTDLVRAWPAFGRWGPDYFRRKFGEVEVEFEAERGGDRDCDANFAAYRRVGRFADYVDRVVAAAPGNDLYTIANNHNLRRPGLRPLFDDLRLPAGYFAEDRLGGGAALWFGPAGTVTSLHHDTSNILFCQVLGRKRLRLGAPGDPALLDAARGVYSRIDPEDPALARVEDGGPHLFDVELAAGEALFLPVGWWHHVRALDLSVSVALNAFSRANSYPWYVPGAR
ncbi:MAG: cupin-like domain-containing protein, partial [Myxococcales bacterium]|nr:cupin-like domain-containing protein [Myxococcales bacterium]